VSEHIGSYFFKPSDLQHLAVMDGQVYGMKDTTPTTNTPRVMIRETLSSNAYFQLEYQEVKGKI